MSGCNVLLSRYNEGKVCSKCENVKKTKEKNEIVEMVRSVTRKTS